MDERMNEKSCAHNNNLAPPLQALDQDFTCVHPFNLHEQPPKVDKETEPQTTK